MVKVSPEKTSDFIATGAIYEEENGKVTLDRRKDHYEQEKIKSERCADCPYRERGTL